ncbi:RNA-binding protein 41 [Engraulis encrasicolus]|uniref:RNA-binding protein 41 n=1 Tax=Engraulis encrasicolus TaxID=184585 RepID=UPI002FD4F15D
MKRITRRDCSDAPVPEEQETEGQRQLHSLLLQQLDTGVDIDRCFAKRQCFAPAAYYKPFGEQAAGVKSLSQFQALQSKEMELAGMREQGLTDREIQLWKSKDKTETASAAPETARGVCMDPEVRSQRLQVIQDKIEARNRLLAQPQRLSASRPLSRREMEIEKALFQGTDRQGFLSALYHQEEEPGSEQSGSAAPDSMHMLYKDFLKEADRDEPAKADSPTESTPVIDQEHSSTDTHTRTQSSSSVVVTDRCLGQSTSSSQDNAASHPPLRTEDNNSQKMTPVSVVNKKMDVSQLIGALRPQQLSAGSRPMGPMTVTGQVELVPEEDILQNKETEEKIRSIPRFQNYQSGQPSNVLCVKNLSPRATVAQLVSLFSRFQQSERPPILYRLLTGRLKGQAFITLADTESAKAALELLHGYRLLDKPLVIEFGREKRDQENTSMQQAEGHSKQVTINNFDKKEIIQPNAPV